MLKEFDQVEFLCDLPDEHIGKGMSGTIVHVYNDGLAFDVEVTIKIDLETGERTNSVVTVKRDEVIAVTQEIKRTTFPTGSDEPSLYVMELRGSVVCISVRDSHWVAYDPKNGVQIGHERFMLDEPIAAAEAWLRSQVVGNG